MMIDRLENMDELFRSGLKDYAPAPPTEIWGRIERDIVKNRKTVLLPLFLKIAAGIVLIASITWLMWRSFNSSSQKQVLSETIQSAPSDVKAASETITPNEIRKSSTVPVSSPNVPEKELVTPVETAISETTEELAILFEESEVEVAPQEVVTYDNIISPMNSRDLMVSSAFADNNYPLIKPGYTEIDYNELIIQQNLLALEDQKNNDRKEGLGWSVGGQAGPQYTYRDVYVNTPSYPVNNFDKYESGLVAYAGGLQFEIEPSSRFSIQSGIYYSKMGQTKSTLQSNPDISTTYTTPNTIDEPERGSNMPDVVNSTGNITFDKDLSPPVSDDENIDWTVGLVTAEQYFEYVEIPFIFRYLIIDRKMDVNLCSGLWANFLVGNKATATDNEDFTTEGETKEINTFGYSGSVSVGLAYPVARNIDISLEPFFKYYLSPINTNPETNVYPYSIGVLTGISYSF